MNQALITAIQKFQADSGLFAGVTPEAIVAGLPSVDAAGWNALSSDLRIQAINIFGLAEIPLPGGVYAPHGDLGPYTPTAMQWTTKTGHNFLRDPNTNYNAEGTAMTRLESMRDASGTQKLYSHKGSPLWNILTGRWRTESDPTGAIIPGGGLTAADRGFWWDKNNNPTFPNWQLHQGNGPSQFPKNPAAPPPPPPVVPAAGRAYWWNADGTPTARNFEIYAGFGPPEFPGDA